MRKIHVKVVLDCWVMAEDSVIDPADVVADTINEVDLTGRANGQVDILDVQIVSSEVTDSR
jgi:hypothetical protein